MSPWSRPTSSWPSRTRSSCDAWAPTWEVEAAAETEWLARYDDQDFSLTDPVSFAVMCARGIREALTLDRHFTTAGLATLA